MFDGLDHINGTAQDILFRFISDVTINRAITQAKKYEEEIIKHSDNRPSNEELININLMWQDIASLASIEA
jgi:23S rRNA maturation-related 3'-5' exoribonuclease YhaM